MLYLLGHDVAFILDWRIKLVREILIGIYRLIQLVYGLLRVDLKFPTMLLLSRKYRLSWLPRTLIVIHSLLTKRWKTLGITFIVVRDLTLLIIAVMKWKVFIVICLISTYHGIKFWLCYVFHLFDGITCEVKLGWLLFIDCDGVHVEVLGNFRWLFIEAVLVYMYLNTFRL